jgi:hypothetical protein
MPKKNKLKPLEHKIDNILGRFHPTKFPVLKAAYPLTGFTKKSLPAYVCNMKHGIEFIVRKGFPYITTPTMIISNTKFREKFNTFFQEVGVRKLTVHGVITSRVFTQMLLLESLINPDKGLPADIAIHTNISVYEDSVEEMIGKNCVETSMAVFGKDGEYIRKVFPATFHEVKSLNELEELAEFTYGNDFASRGLLVVSKDGKYRQGMVPITDTDMAIFSPVENIKAKIEYVNDSYKRLDGKIIPSADSLVFRVGKHMLLYDISHLPHSLKGHFSSIVHTLTGKTAELEVVKLPGQKRPIINRLIKIKM